MFKILVTTYAVDPDIDRALNATTAVLEYHSRSDADAAYDALTVGSIGRSQVGLEQHFLRLY